MSDSSDNSIIRNTPLGYAITPRAGVSEIEVFHDSDIFESGDRFVCMYLSVQEPDADDADVVEVDLTIDQAHALIEMLQRTISHVEEM